MTSRRPCLSWLGFLFITLLGPWGYGAPVAWAQEPTTQRSFDVQLFQTAIGPNPFFTLDSTQVPEHKKFSLSLTTSYQRNPFTIYTVAGENQLEDSVEVVRDQISSELTGAIGLGGRFQLGLAIPLTLFMQGDDFTPMGEASGFALSSRGVGDIRLEGKYYVATFGPSDEFSFSIAPGITLPTGNSEFFMGDRTVTGRLRAITEFRLDDLRAAAMLGALFRQPSKNFAATVGQQLLYGLAVDYRVHRDVSLLGELFGRSGLEEFGQRYVDANPVELDAGMRVGLPRMLALTVGGGIGLVKGIGAPRFRGFLALAWAPDFSDRDGDGIYDAEDRCPDEPEDFDGYKDTDGCPDPDNDGDGIPDAQDKCPNDPEDFDQFQDEDGCPELDNDGDGIPDLNDACPNAAEDGKGKRPNDGCPSSTEDSDGDGVPDGQDKCPEEPEDRDGFEDYDGCPDVDNDDDGIPDNFDLCPNEAEDKDGFEDEDGCPDPDNDKDGIPDAEDKCPNEPETLNGNKDDDGCPDPGAVIVRPLEDKIEVRERVTFSGPANRPTLTSGSQAVLNLVAMVMRGHRDIAKLRIEVQSAGISKEDAQARADAVAAFLTSKGVDAGRLKPMGMVGGGNRVDFIIEEREQPKKAAPAAASQ
jgi:OmpA-OmpF porin, OOP family